MTGEFSGRVAVVTGAALGIGRATAFAFGEAGTFVYLLDIDTERGAEAAGHFEHSRFIRCDVTSEEEVQDSVDQICEQSERIDVLVNNAGGFPAQRNLDDTSLEEWRRIVDLNLTSVFLMTRTALPLLRRSAEGHIINIGSLAGQVANYRTAPPYAAAKAGVHAYTRVLAHELAPDRITVNAIAPSAVLTDRIRAVRDEAERAATATSIPLGRYQTPAELTAWIMFLASEESGFMTGETVAVNGGRFMS